MNMDKGKVLFDERDSEVLRWNRRISAYVVRILSILLWVPFFLFLLNMLDVVPLGERPDWFWIVMASILLFMGIVVFASTFQRSYILTFENGVELHLGFLSKAEFFPFDSIPKLHTKVLDKRGNPTDYMLLEVKGMNRTRYILLDDDFFEDKDRFLRLVGRNISIERKPVERPYPWRK